MHSLEPSKTRTFNFLVLGLPEQHSFFPFVEGKIKQDQMISIATDLQRSFFESKDFRSHLANTTSSFVSRATNKGMQHYFHQHIRDQRYVSNVYPRIFVEAAVLYDGPHRAKDMKELLVWRLH